MLDFLRSEGIDEEIIGKIESFRRAYPLEENNTSRVPVPRFRYYGKDIWEKALIALAIAHADKCPYCIDSYTQTCLQMGIDEEQMTEAVHVAAAMKAGITLVHGVQMKNIVDKLEQ